MRGIIFYISITAILLLDNLVHSFHKFSRNLQQSALSDFLLKEGFYFFQINDIEEQLIPAKEDDDEGHKDLNSVNFGGGAVVSKCSINTQQQTEAYDIMQGVVSRAVIPDVDDRIKINNTIQSPYNAVGLVGSHCTGTAIGPYHILTAAHCVYNRDYKTDVHFTPAQNGQNRPYKTYQWTFAFIPEKFFTDDHTTQTQNDYALIILNEKLHPQITPLEFGNSCNNINNFEQKYQIFNLAGYPGDLLNNTMYQSNCTNIQYQCEWKTFAHNCDTCDGMSGGSLFVESPLGGESVGFQVRAIHTGFNNNYQLNQALIISDEVEAQIRDWMDTFEIREAENHA